MHVLLVEDDPSISEPLVRGLEREGYEVDVAETGRQALAAPAGSLDLVLLDLGLPDLDGHVVCRELRSRTDVPIIVVSARGEEIDRVTLLDLGADDYVVKPFGFRELVARIRAVLRRTAPDTPASGLDGGGPRHAMSDVVVGDLVIDRRTRKVALDGEEVYLTPKEFDLLVCLAEDPGAVMTRGDLIRSVWDENWWGPTKTLDVHVASLRKKLRPELIETIRSVGYRLAVGEDG